jgi:hypothetical protein
MYCTHTISCSQTTIKLHICRNPSSPMKKHRINDNMKNIIIFILFYRMRQANLFLEERVPVCVVVLWFVSECDLCDYRQDLVRYKCGNLDLLKWTEFCSCWLNLQIWIFRTPLLINSLTINSVFIYRAEHHGFLLTIIKIRVVPDVPWCWEARLQWPSFDPRQILRYYWSRTVDWASSIFDYCVLWCVF